MASILSMRSHSHSDSLEFAGPKTEQGFLQQINPAKIPRHIAIIMDGNGRWAKQRHLPRVFGHRAGITSVREVVRACGELSVKVLTLYAFSAENWRVPIPKCRP
jgi:undecaprenyl diphosphate synthase